MKIQGLKAPKTLMVFGDDDGGLPISNFDPKPTRLIQVIQGCRWREAQAIDRSNSQTNLTFDVDGGFASHTDCQWFVLTQEAKLVGQWDVTITVGGRGEAMKTCWIQSAVVQASPRYNGVAWVAQYQITGGRIRETSKDTD